jgi:hypothetical protein
MSRVVEGAARLQREVGGLVLLVHHAGKEAGRGPRGHSSQLAALDAAIEVVRVETGERRWRIDKTKDAVDGAEHPFSLRVIELECDEDGDPITSCVVVPGEAQTGSAPRHKPTSAEQLAIGAFRLAAKEAGRIDDSGRPLPMPLEAWRDAYYTRSTADTPAAKKKAFQRVRLSLQAAGILTVKDDVYALRMD